MAALFSGGGSHSIGGRNPHCVGQESSSSNETLLWRQNEIGKKRENKGQGEERPNSNRHLLSVFTLAEASCQFDYFSYFSKCYSDSTGQRSNVVVDVGLLRVKIVSIFQTAEDE